MSDVEPEPGPEPEAEPERLEPAVPAWVPLLTGTGMALAVVSALALVGIVAQGFAVQQRLNAFDKLGVAFLQNLDDTPIGVMLVLAVLLVMLPVVVAGTRSDLRDDRRAQLTLVLVVAVAALVAVAAVAGVVTRLRLDDARGQGVTSATRRALATFLVRNLGTALIALGAALGAIRIRSGSPRDVTPSP